MQLLGILNVNVLFFFLLCFLPKQGKTLQQLKRKFV